VRCYRAVRDIPECQLAVGAEISSDATEPQQDNSLATEVTVRSAASAVACGSGSPDEAAQPSVNVEAAAAESEQPDTDSKERAQSTAGAAQQKMSAQSPSNIYMRAIIPNLDSIIAENDFSSLDAEKRQVVLQFDKGMFVYSLDA